VKTYLIAYDLNCLGREYYDLIIAIKQMGNWWHHLDRTWIVKTNLSAEQISNRLAQYIDRSDELLVVALAGEGAWIGFHRRGSDWLKENLLATGNSLMSGDEDAQPGLETWGLSPARESERSSNEK
jgi:hypothetical protein